MDHRHRGIIEEYRNLITNNLILTDDFYRVLVTYGIFTEGLVKDLRKEPRAQISSKLVDLLLTRNNAGYGKFCDVLEVTGHHFLSDCLREAENVETTQELDIDDVMRKLPFLGKSIKNDQQKAALQKYFKDKIHNEVVKQTWRGDISTKERLMVTRQQQIEQIWQYEEESKIKDKTMAELQGDYMKMQERADDLRREIKSLHKHIEDMTRQHNEQLSTQLKFNMANDRHLNRLSERAEDAGSYLANIHVEVKSLLGESYYERQARTEYQNLEENFHKFIKQYKETIQFSEKFREERDYMSNQIAGRLVPDAQSIKPYFQEYIMKNEELKAQLDRRINELGEVNETQKRRIQELHWVQKKLDDEKMSGNQNTEQAVMALQKEIADASTKIKVRDEKISALETDLASIAEKVKKMEKALAESQENAQKYRDMANQLLPKTKTPPKTPAVVKGPPVNHEQSAITNHYKKPTMTRSTGVFIMNRNDETISSLDAIKGQALVKNSEQGLPAGVKKIEQGNIQAAVKNASTLNATANRDSTSRINTTKPARRY